MKENSNNSSDNPNIRNEIKSKKNKNKRKRKFSLKPGAVIVLSFLSVILLGSILLILPISIKEGQSLSYIDSLFTSVSAVCVTGLATKDIYDTFTIFGQAVVAILIQLGGLGVTTFSVGLIMISNGTLSVRQSTIIKENWNIDTFKDIKKVFFKVLLYTAVCELIGAFLSVISFSQHMEIGKAFATGFFHSIASFNNAGFDILGGFSSLVNYSNDVLLNIVTCLLIMLGGIGFLVVIDVIKCKFRFKKFKLHTKVVLCMNFFLWLFNFFIIKFLDWNNLAWNEAFFFSVSTRTAGFSVTPLSTLNQSTLVLFSVLMYIGCAPGSTGGGIKVTTMYVIFIHLRSVFTGRYPHAFKKAVSKGDIRKACGLILLSLALILLSTFGLSCIEQTKVINGITYDAFDFFFESVSAFATVGLSTGFTPYFHWGSKIIIILVMFIGRIGPMTIATLFSKEEVLSTARYLEENISIG